MKENLEKANQALLEGDRDGVLRLLHSESETTEVSWLRAHSATTDEQRIEILTQIASEGEGEYSRLAAEILEREKRFADQLSEPPDYQFWKQPTWAKRLEKMRAYRIWIFGAVLLLVIILVGAFLNKSNQDQFKQDYLVVQATQTAAAVFSQPVATYAAGKLTIINVEDPTIRGVTFGDSQDDQLIPGQPASGARFVAVQLNFTCGLALCDAPPQATVNLVLANDQIVTYDSSRRPFLIDQTLNNLPRISQGQIIQIWFVFEVPNSMSPKALQIISGEQEVPQYIAWPIR